MTFPANSNLPLPLYDAAGVRSLDQLVISEQGIAAAVLMQRAGCFAFAQLQQQWPTARRLWVLCGGGNNGGDGYVVAARAKARGWQVELRYLVAPTTLSGAARQAYDFARQEQVVMAAFDGAEAIDADVVVDGLLGTGLHSLVSGEFAQAINAANASGLPVLALDIASGLSANTGAVLGVAVRAQLTTTFVGLKFGQFTGAGRSLTGRLAFDNLGAKLDPCKLPPSRAQRLCYSTLIAQLPARARDSHKGDFGHTVVVGGDNGYGGAALIAAAAALRSGSGTVSLISRAATVAAALQRQPEVMGLAVDAGIESVALIERATALVVGPGLGKSAWGEQLLAQCLLGIKQGAAAVIDADALNLLAQRPPLALGARVVLTPHPGEAARLLGMSSAQVQADRGAAARALQLKYSCVVVLKGAGTLVACDGVEPQLSLVDAGNPGMASGGMGDLLAGVIGALLAQGIGAALAAQLGAQLHAMAGDLESQANGQRGLLATDLLPRLRHLFNGFAR